MIDPDHYPEGKAYVLDLLRRADEDRPDDTIASLRADVERLAGLHNRTAAQLEIATTALIKIDRGAKAVREVAGLALLKVAMVPYPNSLAPTPSDPSPSRVGEG